MTSTETKSTKHHLFPFNRCAFQQIFLKRWTKQICSGNHSTLENLANTKQWKRYAPAPQILANMWLWFFVLFTLLIAFDLILIQRCKPDFSRPRPTLFSPSERHRIRRIPLKRKLSNLSSNAMPPRNMLLPLTTCEQVIKIFGAVKKRSGCSNLGCRETERRQYLGL